MRTIIQNGTIVSDTAAFRADLLLHTVKTACHKVI